MTSSFIKGTYLSVMAGLALSCAVFSSSAAADELVMFEKEGCNWCKIWHRDVGDGYAASKEGLRLPLRRVDLADDRPADLAHIKSVIFTPTFVVMSCGKEKGRITGYPGEMHFYGLLAEVLARLDENPEKTCSSQVSSHPQ